MPPEHQQQILSIYGVISEKTGVFRKWQLGYSFPLLAYRIVFTKINQRSKE
jgi:hypothetical protein